MEQPFSLESAVRHHIDSHLDLVRKMRETLAFPIARFAAMVEETISRGNTLLVFGNGGSAADAQHFAAEIVGRFRRDRSAWPALALTTDTSIMTAVGNDYGFEQVFSRQVEGLARPGDLVVGISTSGTSENVRRGLETARSIGCRTAALLGRDGGTIRPIVDMPVVVESRETARIQEVHALIIHIVCDMVESALCGGDGD